MNTQIWLQGHKQLLCALLGFWIWPAQAQVLISEIFYDAVGPDNGLTFVELLGTPCTLLDGLSLLGINGADGSTYKTVPLFGTIPGDEIFVVGDDDGSGRTLVPNADLIADVDFQNGPDSIVLWDGNSVLDAVGYGDFTAALFAGEGFPAVDVAAGTSLARWSRFGDSNNNSADFVAVLAPTPGIPPLTEVPVPGTIGFFAAGLLLGCARMLIST